VKSGLYRDELGASQRLATADLAENIEDIAEQIDLETAILRSLDRLGIEESFN
jgi:hypothetical protein